MPTSAPLVATTASVEGKLSLTLTLNDSSLQLHLILYFPLFIYTDLG